MPLELARDGVVGSAANKAAAAKAPKTAMKLVIRNSHRGSWFVPLELARDGVVGPLLLRLPRRCGVLGCQAGCKYDWHCCC